MMLRAKVALLMIAAVTTTGAAQSPGEKAHSAPETVVQAVRRAAMDYLDGFYEGDTTKLVRSVSPTVAKYGYFIKQGESKYTGEPMPFAEFMSYTNSVKRNNRQAPATAPKEVTVYEVLDQTAVAKVVACWGATISISRKKMAAG